MKKKVLVFLLSLALCVGLVGALGNDQAQASDITLRIDGRVVQSDVAPFILDGRTMVPVRVISETLGSQVEWDPDQQMVSVMRFDKNTFIMQSDIISIFIDNPVAVSFDKNYLNAEVQKAVETGNLNLFDGLMDDIDAFNPNAANLQQEADIFNSQFQGRMQASILDVPPVIRDGRTFVPLRFIAEALGEDVQWDGNTRTVYIG